VGQNVIRLSNSQASTREDERARGVHTTLRGVDCYECAIVLVVGSPLTSESGSNPTRQ
jgi:hypothetical protein